MAVIEIRDLRNLIAVDFGTNFDFRLWFLERELDDFKRFFRDKDLEIDEL